MPTPTVSMRIPPRASGLNGYQRLILAVLGPLPEGDELREGDPRLIEAWMREKWPTLDHLKLWDFQTEASAAFQLVLQDRALSVKLADSMGIT